MWLPLTFLLSAASLASSASIARRQDAPMQFIPTTPKADNTFSNGLENGKWPPAESSETPSSEYGNRAVDLPFGRMFHGNLKFFSAGQLNSPNSDTDLPLSRGGTDSAKQSACGIPNNAYYQSHVAIHPYFLKYADLSRWCEQDVCISFWKDDGSSDMMLKVTDICSTDPNDPTHCATPADIKVDRHKVLQMENPQMQIIDVGPDMTPLPQGDQYDGGKDGQAMTWWFFMKCWADGLPNPAYSDNWFAQPPLPNNLAWAQATQLEQWKRNNVSYPAQNPPLPTYPNSAYQTVRNDETAPPTPDFDPDQTYDYTPIAGGKGWGNPTSGGTLYSPGSASGTDSGAGSAAASGFAPVSSSSVAPVAAVPSSASPAAFSGQESGQGSVPGKLQANVVPAITSTTAPAITTEDDEQDECDADEM